MKRHVALIVETSSIYGRQVLSGIIQHMRMFDDWSVFLDQHDLTQEPPRWLANWAGDGIISRTTTPELLQTVQATGVPLIELTDRHQSHGRTYVWSDDAAIGRMGAEHLLERGFREFGFCGFTNEAWSERRQDAFSQRVEAAQRRCHQYESPWYGPDALSWEEEQQRLRAWLRTLPSSCGIMACNDLRGQQVVDACLQEGLSVPEEVAIIGADNDTLLCRVCSPPMSSVIPNAEGVGFRAAELLTQLMNGEVPQKTEHLIQPLGVAERQSTDVVAIDDPDIAAALRYIRENACRGINVVDVTDNVAISRSSLERKLRQYLSRTPQQEIRHVQIKRVCELLTSTELPAEQIATLCGFDNPEYMYVVFRRIVGMTPGKFRSKAKSG
ncbi:Xylose operon regulatory protein [Rosistilla oblonga]|uniref:XylR family transcriptional regulator n=1 Tax=Rosistilla oblonga TaxID=2527990 RepID=UPI001188BE87|nr:DNA-binding transcriptional regulator [Rosistilla oblonga]QDV10423.1 Xylose operon regulatory protein [Rosistilla oblonga]